MGSKYFKEISTTPVIIARNLYLYRHVLSQMVIRDIKGRFAGSVGGLLWHFVDPIIKLFVYLFVFVYVFKLRIGAAGDTGASAIFIMAGLFPWIILSEGLSRGVSSLVANANLIQKTYFPTEILTTNAVIVPFLSYGIPIILLIVYKIIFSGFIGIVFFIPIVLMFQFFFTLGLAFLSAAISVFFRDVIHIIQIIISFWIFLTPILYPVNMLPEWAKKVMYFNPLYPFISIYQSLFINGNMGQWKMLPLAFVWTLFFFIIGGFVFSKLKEEFVDWL